MTPGARLQSAIEILNDIFRPQLDRRYIQGNKKSLRPGLCLFAYLAEQGEGQLIDQPAILSDGNETVRWHHAHVRMVPAREDFIPFNRIVREADKRLVMGLNLPGPDGLTQIRLKGQAQGRLLVHLLIEIDLAASSPLFCAVKRHIGLFEDLRDTEIRLRMNEGDPGTCIDITDDPADFDTLCNRAKQAGHDTVEFFITGRITEDGGKLVPAEAADNVRLPDI